VKKENNLLRLSKIFHFLFRGKEQRQEESLGTDQGGFQTEKKQAQTRRPQKETRAFGAKEKRSGQASSGGGGKIAQPFRAVEAAQKSSAPVKRKSSKKGLEFKKGSPPESQEDALGATLSSRGSSTLSQGDYVQLIRKHLRGGKILSHQNKAL